MARQPQELVVRGEQVERIYANFIDKKFIVNRRYQRKLIWTIEEKEKFIDSIMNGYPVPIILLAEPVDRQDGTMEIIDGMQRMDAITSFVNNDFSVDGHYFDLNTVARTKALLDTGVLEQKTPMMDREVCVSIASYPIPLSIYEFAEGESVDEVFRRINSGGRQLSRQELRTAGATNSFADCVRIISSRVRGDSSSSNILLLNAMKDISITNRELDYGISADSVFWVQNGILTKDNLRQSRDEELIADLISYMVTDAPVASRIELLDDYYGNFFPFSGTREERFSAMDQSVRKRTPELVELDFQRVHDAIILLLDIADVSFSNLLFPTGINNPVPRYYQAVFLAIHELIVRQSMAVADREGLCTQLRDSGRNIVIQEGGRWGVRNRADAIKTVTGMIRGHFEQDKNPDPSTVHWVTKFQNLLTNSTIEQSAYDFKQGFLTLSAPPTFDSASFEKILKTCAAISNISKQGKGYVIVGVAETSATALRVEEIFTVQSISYNGHYIVGVEHEANALGKNLDQLFQYITDKIKASMLSEPLKSYVNTHLKCVQYYDKMVFVFEILGQDNPSLYDDKYFERQGAQVIEVPNKNLPSLFARFN